MFEFLFIFLVAFIATKENSALKFDCGTTELSNFTAPVVYPLAGGQYEANDTCEWKISPPSGFLTTITIFDVDINSGNTSCGNDTLEIVARDKVVQTICANLTQNSSTAVTVPATDCAIILRFNSDTSGSGAGFKFNWTFTEVKDCIVTNFSEPGNLSFPLSGSFYKTSQNCSWMIIGKLDYVIKLTIFQIDIEPLADYLEILEGGVSMKKVFGKYKTADYVYFAKPGKTVFLMFYSDSYIIGTGFKAVWEFVWNPPIVPPVDVCATPPDSSVCSSVGDPHYKTFDQKTFDFMGTCTYDFAFPCKLNSSSNLTDFLVQVTNNRKPGWVGVSYTKSVSLLIGNATFTIDGQIVTINGEVVNPPIVYNLTSNGSTVEITLSCGFINIKTDFGLKLKYDGLMNAYLELSDKYKGVMCGFCGNFDGDKSNDLVLSTGSPTMNVNNFCNSHVSKNVTENSNCELVTVDPTPGCTSPEQLDRITLFCAKMADHIIFKPCFSFILPEFFIKMCIFDQCAVPNDPSMSCNAFMSFAIECARLSGQPIDWISASGCSPLCKVNEEYRANISVCENSCRNPLAESNCPSNLTASYCTCKAGFIRSGTVCVPADSCGCTDSNGKYRKKGEVWLTNLCTTINTCTGFNIITNVSKPLGCGPAGVCTLFNLLSTSDYYCKPIVVPIPGCSCKPPVDSSTCHAIGDPHYKTFDQKKYDFQGSCTYDLVYLCSLTGNGSIPMFYVRASNRPDPPVAYVKWVSVEILGKVFKIGKKIFTVDNQVVQPPYTHSFDDGSTIVFLIKCCKTYKIITNFGLVVTYDGVSKAYVHLDKSFKGKVCGMCGNFDGNMLNDFVDKAGTAITGVNDFGLAYISANQTENKHCPAPPVTPDVCSKPSSICDMLNGTNFQPYHALVPIDYYYHMCAYDSCLFPTNPELPCIIIEKYVAEVINAGGPQIDWVGITNCVPKCGPNEIYSKNVSLCENTCQNPNATSNCTLGTTDGCVCQEGFILSGANCVPASECGCTDTNGRYRAKGEVWLTKNCLTKNTCVGNNVILVTSSVGCSGNGQCIARDKSLFSDYYCFYPVVIPIYGNMTPSGNYHECHAVGDPHYLTFDKQKYNFMGICVYDLAFPCGSAFLSSGLPFFRVRTSNTLLSGGAKVSYVKWVSIEVLDIVIMLGQKKVVKINDQVVALPLQYTFDNSPITIDFTVGAKNIKVKTSFGLVVQWDGRSLAFVYLDAIYKTFMCGLCGDFDGNPKNDYKLPNGTLVTSPTVFGNSWISTNTTQNKKCPVAVDPPNTCGIPDQNKTVHDRCSVLKNHTVFQPCHSYVPVDDFFNHCVFDQCAQVNNPDLSCQMIGLYAEECRKVAGLTLSWRNISNCYPKCEANEVFSETASLCLNTCQHPNASNNCTLGTTEACVCDTGFVLCGTQCVPQSECGCTDARGVYHKKNTSWLSSDCKIKYTCVAPEVIDITDFRGCGPFATCVPTFMGNYGCKPIMPPKPIGCQSLANSSYCHAIGDPHYKSFDSKKFNFMGLCTYDLVFPCGDYSLLGLPYFLVRETNKPFPNNAAISYAISVQILIMGKEFVIGPKKIFVDDVEITPPYTFLFDDGVTQVEIDRQCKYVQLFTSFGLLVKYDMKSRVVVELSKLYANSVCGMCGDMDGSPKNDFLLPDGMNQAASALIFGNAWISKNITATANCPATVIDNGTCTAENNATAVQFCSVITTHPDFVACNSYVNPADFLDDCVFDKCALAADPAVACKVIEHYADACLKAANLTIAWRNISGCNPTCGVNEIYKESALMCENTCQNPDAVTTCKLGFIDGCFCDNGFIRNGLNCVPPSECGCTDVNGVNHQTGSSWLTEGCTVLNECVGPNNITVTTKPGCPANFQCVASDQTAQATFICKPNVVLPPIDPVYPNPNSSICHAIGDPHYKTFDGKKINFMGVCTYDLVFPCAGNASVLPYFVVRESNVKRSPSDSVSYVREVALEFKGKVFKISKILKVDDDVVQPPFTHDFQDGQNIIVVKKIGKYLTIITNFGLIVSFDGVSRAYVELDSKYANLTCGMCGNYDRNKNNDMILRSGLATTSEKDFGDSWLSPGLPENEKCPGTPDIVNQCGNPSKLTEVTTLCQKINEINGCDVLDKQLYIDHCIFDQCAFLGNPNVTCDIFEAFADECKKVVGINVDWKIPSGCVAQCGENQEYVGNAPLCHKTCQEPNGPATCAAGTGDGCFCKAGYVLSGMTCVLATECGCTDSFGRYRMKGESWIGLNCETINTCTGSNTITTTPYPGCPQGSLCYHKLPPNSIEYGCKPVVILPGSSGCEATGDPHYVTFDRKKYNFQGLCTYNFAYPCKDYQSLGLPYFLVRVSNERRKGWTKVSSTKMISLTVQGKTFKIIRRRIEVDGVKVNPGYKYTFPDTKLKVSIVLSGPFIKINTNFGVVIKYNGKMNAFLTVSNSYRGNMCGLCGNMDKIATNEFVKANGDITTNIVEFGNSHQSTGVVENKYCPITIIDPTPPTCSTPEQTTTVTNLCNSMINLPIFQACHAAIPPNATVEDCIFDQCVDVNNPELTCTNFELYAARCRQEANVTIDWSSVGNCAVTCPVNQIYSLNASLCENTCQNPNAVAECTDGFHDACVCAAGYIRSGKNCVLASSCGCTDENGKYHLQGESWLGANCTIKFTCVAANTTQSTNLIGCPTNQVCKPLDAANPTEYHCVPVVIIPKPCPCTTPPNWGQCSSLGDPHYTTFDKKKYNFMGLCTYDLVKPCGAFAAANLTDFLVQASNERRAGSSKSVTYTKWVSLTVGGKTIKLLKGNKVQINGIPVNPPLFLDFPDKGFHLNITHSCKALNILTSFGLLVQYNGVSNGYVKISSAYKGFTCGLCGDFDGVPSNDFKTKTGTVVTSPIEFGNSWQSVGVVENSYCPIVATEPPSSCGTAAEATAINTTCGLIATASVLQPCTSVMNATEFIDHCIYDQCSEANGTELICNMIETYAKECSSLLGMPIDWSSVYSCGPICPANETYQTNVTECEKSCLPDDVTSNCTVNTTSGCFCQPGYVRSGASCVLPNECGCTIPGAVYLPLGESVFLDNCTTQVKCLNPNYLEGIEINGCENGTTCQSLADMSFQFCVANVTDPNSTLTTTVNPNTPTSSFDPNSTISSTTLNPNISTVSFDPNSTISSTTLNPNISTVSFDPNSTISSTTLNSNISTISLDPNSTSSSTTISTNLNSTSVSINPNSTSVSMNPNSTTISIDPNSTTPYVRPTTVTTPATTSGSCHIKQSSILLAGFFAMLLLLINRLL